MKFGLLISSQYLAQESIAGKIGEALEQVAAARDAGFHLVCVGQHHLSAPYQMPSSFPVLARFAAESGDMQIAATVILLPLHNPVELAESVVTLDAITGGKFVFGIGLGYREEEYEAFGVKRDERVGRFLESLRVMRMLWTEEEVEFHGKYYNVPRTVPVTRPVQKPHPPIWVAANHDSAIKRAAKLGYCWLINPHATIAMIQKQVAVYQEALIWQGNEAPQEVPMMRELSINRDRGKAIAEGRPYLESKYREYAAWGQDKALPGGESFAVPFEDLARDRFLIGDPEDVVAEVRKYEEQLGVNHMIFRLQWPGRPHHEAMEQIHLMGKDVIPRFKSSAAAKTA